MCIELLLDFFIFLVVVEVAISDCENTSLSYALKILLKYVSIISKMYLESIKSKSTHNGEKLP